MSPDIVKYPHGTKWTLTEKNWHVVCRCTQTKMRGWPSSSDLIKLWFVKILLIYNKHHATTSSLSHSVAHCGQFHKLKVCILSFLLLFSSLFSSLFLFLIPPPFLSSSSSSSSFPFFFFVLFLFFFCSLLLLLIYLSIYNLSSSISLWHILSSQKSSAILYELIL